MSESANRLVAHIALPLLICGCAAKTADVARTGTQPDGPVSYSADVAPLLFENCAGCHRPAGPAPFSVLSYPDVEPWAPLIVDAVTQRRMPPWLPDQGVGTFLDERRLSNDEIAIIRRLGWSSLGHRAGGPAYGGPFDNPCDQGSGVAFWHCAARRRNDATLAWAAVRGRVPRDR